MKKFHVCFKYQKKVAAQKGYSTVFYGTPEVKNTVMGFVYARTVGGAVKAACSLWDIPHGWVTNAHVEEV